jgi:hypothetical protein
VQISKEKVNTDDVDTPSALVLCDSRLHRVALYRNSAAVDYALTALYLANLTAVSFYCSRNDTCSDSL